MAVGSPLPLRRWARHKYRMFDHLYDDEGFPTVEAKIWYLDVCDGRIALLPEQRDHFFHLMELRQTDSFYSDAYEGFLFEFPRIEMKFHAMVNTD